MIFVFGNNIEGQCGIANGEDFILKPISIPINIIDPSKVCRIICSSNSTFIIYNDGSLYSAGAGEIGRTGKRSIFQRIDSIEVFQIVDACLGEGFFNLCTKDMKLIGCGKNELGTLGNGTRDNRDKPKLNTNFPEDVLMVQSGLNHVIVLTKKGNIFAFGDNRNGQLGDGLFQSIANPTVPIQQLRHRPIISISCGSEYTIAMTITGNLYSWGRNNVGQLGDQYYYYYYSYYYYDYYYDYYYYYCLGLGDFVTRLRPELIRLIFLVIFIHY